MSDFGKARSLLREFKGDGYLFGAGVLSRLGKVVAGVGKQAALVRGTFPGSDDYVQIIGNSLAEAGVGLAGEIRGARPNAPRQDLFRITDELKALDADVLISFGGGSTIDAAKAAEVTFGDVEAAMPGTVLGKVLEPLDAGEALIYIFVTLQ